jgi:hypothetical protein
VNRPIGKVLSHVGESAALSRAGLILNNELAAARLQPMHHDRVEGGYLATRGSAAKPKCRS